MDEDTSVSTPHLSSICLSVARQQRDKSLANVSWTSATCSGRRPAETQLRPVAHSTFSTRLPSLNLMQSNTSPPICWDTKLTSPSLRKPIWRSIWCSCICVKKGHYTLTNRPTDRPQVQHWRVRTVPAWWRRTTRCWWRCCLCRLCVDMWTTRRNLNYYVSDSNCKDTVLSLAQYTIPRNRCVGHKLRSRIRYLSKKIANFNEFSEIKKTS